MGEFPLHCFDKADILEHFNVSVNAGNGCVFAWVLRDKRMEHRGGHRLGFKQRDEFSTYRVQDSFDSIHTLRYIRDFLSIMQITALLRIRDKFQHFAKRIRPS